MMEENTEVTTANPKFSTKLNNNQVVDFKLEYSYLYSIDGVGLFEEDYNYKEKALDRNVSTILY